MADTTHDTTGSTLDRRTGRHLMAKATTIAIAYAVLATAPLGAQSAVGRATELGIDAGAVFGLGSQSSIDVNLPGTRFRIGFFTPGSRISIEPAVGLGYNKVEGTDGTFRYDLELGLLYHFTPITMSTARTARVTAPYVRPFIGVTGYTAGSGGSDNEVTAGAGLGIKIPWRTDLAWRLEGNLGYGFDNKAGRLGLLAGLSYFPR
jgi:hypothetical protein